MLSIYIVFLISLRSTYGMQAYLSAPPNFYGSYDILYIIRTSYYLAQSLYSLAGRKYHSSMTTNHKRTSTISPTKSTHTWVHIYKSGSLKLKDDIKFGSSDWPSPLTPGSIWIHLTNALTSMSICALSFEDFPTQLE